MAGFEGRLPWGARRSMRSRANETSRIEFAVATPMHIDRQRRNIERGARDQREQQMPASRPRQRGDDHEGSSQLKLHTISGRQRDMFAAPRRAARFCGLLVNFGLAGCWAPGPV